MNEERDRKLAEWAGFKMQTLDDLEPRFRHPANLRLVAPDGSRHLTLDLTSLDAIFKWLVPKLQEQGYLVALRLLGSIAGGWEAEIGKGYFPYEVYSTARAEEPALALCKAIEQLIEEVKDERGNSSNSS